MSPRRLAVAGHAGQRWPGMQPSRMDVISWLVAGGEVVVWLGRYALCRIDCRHRHRHSTEFGSCLEVVFKSFYRVIYVGIVQAARKKDT